MINIANYSLNDKYTTKQQQVFLTGTQALVRIMIDQGRRDKNNGLNTAGFVSGYRGSPLGMVDKEMLAASELLQQHHVDFMPAINEDLGATAVLGTQQAPKFAASQYTGVFSLWYGKGPGVDRSGDALKHGNFYGSHPQGGVLVVAGDDHGCVSSSMPNQSDPVFIAWQMPILNPASVSEYLRFAEYGFALSRYSGTWVAFKAISETVESAATVILQPDRQFVTPSYQPPCDIHVRQIELPGVEIEQRMYHKLEAVQAFLAANPIDERIYNVASAKFGFVTTGKAHLDLLEALRLLGLHQQECQDLGIDIYKVGMVWPLARKNALDYVSGKQEVLVIEEKRGVIESQLKEYFYDWQGNKPDVMVGKHDETGQPLLPWVGEMNPLLLVSIIAKRLHAFFPTLGLLAKADELTSFKPLELAVAGATRKPYFCSGCPHNTSTKVPEGSEASLGIGCHVMAGWMNRNSYGIAQMGGEGVPWSSLSRFLCVEGKQPHRFQNMGDGTWYHSGSLAIRQAVAAGANITFKILYNDAVAMTGGQAVDGPINVPMIAHSSIAEGVATVALVSDQPRKFTQKNLPPQVRIHPREELDQVQRYLRDISGVTVLIYEQTCATEQRRQRKAGKLHDPQRFPVINHHVCEACGDCSIQSNCLSIEPRETPMGRKRQVNLSNCNKDYSCLKGFCPSFVTVERTRLSKSTGQVIDYSQWESKLPLPVSAKLTQPTNILVTGVGGTGVVTLGALITMAAHLESKGASVLDFTGFSQKFGPVMSFIRLAATPKELHQVRIQPTGADTVIACDLVVSSSPEASKYYRKGTQMVLNTASMPTGDMVLYRDANLQVEQRQTVIGKAIGKQCLRTLDANVMAERMLGNSIFSNIIMLGYAWQQGYLPISLTAIQRAIHLNNVAIETNLKAFLLGRILAAAPQALSTQKSVTDVPESRIGTITETLSEAIAHNSKWLRAYQTPAYAELYKQRLQAIWHDGNNLAEPQKISIANTLRKLMAYKDEYEVARLFTDTDFKQELKQRFESGGKLVYHIAPSFLLLGKDALGRPKKIACGPWLGYVFSLLAKAKGLRGTPFDIFGYSEERRTERNLPDWFLQNLAWALAHDTIDEYLHIVNDIRGFGPVKAKAIQQAKSQVRELLARIAKS